MKRTEFLCILFVLGFLLSVHAQAQDSIGNSAGDALSSPGTSTVLGNVSARVVVQSGNNVLIGGFIVSGTQPKKVIVRAIGPSLSAQGVPVPGRLPDTTLELVGPGGTIATNDNWHSTQETEIIASMVPPTNDLESAIVATLPANGASYTAIVRGAGSATGLGLVEVYDLDRAVDSQLANVSARGLVQTGNNVMIGGFILVGSGSRRVLVRGLGPSLSIAGKLADPTLDLADQNGMILATNDNWRSSQEAEIIATTVAPPDDLESAIVATLPAAPYTAVVRGKNGTTGVASVEVFALSFTGAVSRKTHGSAGAFDINLPANGSGIECRSGGVNGDYTIVANFGRPVTFSNASLSSGSGSVSSTSGSGTASLTVNLTGVTSGQRLTLLLTGVNDGSNTFNVSIPMGVLIGDTNGNGAVSGSDVSQTKVAAQTGTVTAGTFRTDVNASGAINSSDISLVASKSGTMLPP